MGMSGARRQELRPLVAGIPISTDTLCKASKPLDRQPAWRA